MNYIYKAAWSVVGGINLPKDSPPIDLYQSQQYRFVLTNNLNVQFADVDKGAAIAQLMLKSFFGPHETESPPDPLEAQIQEIRAERARRGGSYPALVLEANGVIEAEIREPLREEEDYIITFDAFNKRAVAQRYESCVKAMKVAVAFESQVPSAFFSLAEGTYLQNESRKLVYSINVSASGALTVSTGLPPDGPARISSRYDMLREANDLESVARLASQMADYENDRLKAFLAGWMALEILIAKTFKAYEHIFLSPLINAPQANLRERFMLRMKEVMKDKYRLTDKFVAVAAVLFPDAPDDELQEDFQKFSQFKKLRDSFSHGEDVPEGSLPVRELATLLRKYVLAHIAKPSPR